jgi:hypothetical protein
MGGVNGGQTNLGGSFKTKNERGFSCSSCKRQLIYDTRYQCTICEDVAICK